MWFSRPRLNVTTDAAGSAFGIGVLVHVSESPTQAEDAFRGEPTGVIVGLGSQLPQQGVTAQTRQGRTWVVAFDEPQFLPDGRGPFERATLSEEYLVAAPPVE